MTSGQQDTWPNSAPDEFHAYTVDYTPPKLRITEVLAINNAVNTDEFGENDDWFEIHNEDDVTINLGGMYVGNTLGASRAFELPSINLAVNEYLLLWADDDTAQGDLHVNFRLSSAGETVALFETIERGNVLIHGWKYGIMSPDVSMGFKPQEGSAPEYLATPTPGASNANSELFSPVCINEFQSTSDFGGPDDWIEIYNRGNTAYDLSGCFLSDERSNNTKWTFPHGTILDPGEYLVVFEDVLNFGLSSSGNDVIIFTDSDSTTGLDFYDFGPQMADISEGRTPDGASNWVFFDEPTRGRANANISAIEDDRISIPTTIALFQNYPNPFNPETSIEYTLPVESQVKLEIYNMAGQKVKTLVDKKQSQGRYQIKWNGLTAASELAASGVYFYKLDAEGLSQTRKMLMIK